ncbi:MAG: R3H domain-containing nucleic acid-binding protein [Gammaproteobacteria bacterium]|jgi:stage III sporulation protein SpoIIIAA|nr:R3H domain-containing nucleic acid-binding protein [Gammaproteobacteria bacterium]
MTVKPHTDDLRLLIDTLPETLQQSVRPYAGDQLLEIVLDLGRPPQARLPGRAVDLASTAITRNDLSAVITRIGAFGSDNRAGIEGTLHRISAIRNRRGDIVGLTLRVGRALFGTIDLIRDLIEGGQSVLLLGRPGVGKTTKLREIARVLADEFQKRVIVIDTSNEIAGDGDIPHVAIGSARRMQVASPEAQHAVMIEAVENHMPEVIIIDEIGTAAEALAARTIAERGVQLIGTAHGNTLDNLVRNPVLSDLIGGVQTVTLGDEEARIRGTQKTISERKAPPTFTAVVEIVGHEELIVHADTAQAVDDLLRGSPPRGLRRTPEGEQAIETPMAMQRPARAPGVQGRPLSTGDLRGTVRIFPYAFGRDILERVIRDLQIDARVVNRPERAQLIITLRSRTGDSRLQRIAQASGATVHAVKKNSTAQLRHLLRDLFNLMPGFDEREAEAAVRETEEGIQRALSEGVAVTLAPRSASLRRLQHRVASRHHLIAESIGSEPGRHLVIYPHAFAAETGDKVNEER